MALSILVALLTGVAAADTNSLSGAYRWESGGFVDILAWNEMGPGQLVAFDDAGWVRALFAAGGRSFTAGRSIAMPEPVAARVRFEPADGDGLARTLVWEEEGRPPRVARRVEDGRAETVLFANGDTRLEGTLYTPATAGRHPALVLVHGSGPQNRYGTLPFARFLVRYGIAILTYDKRGVGASRGDWRKASFETLADDALAAVRFLRSRGDIHRKRIGLFGVSQGGWIGPLVASRSRDVALVVSISGPGVVPAEHTLDMLAAEMRITGVPDEEIEEALGLTRLALHYGRTGAGWEEYMAARARSGERPWLPYLPLPEDPKDGLWEQQRLFWHYDPRPALAALRCPVLAIFGGKDPGVPAEKNLRAWDEGLSGKGHRKNSLVTLPAANHLMLVGDTGSMFEIPGLDRFVPEYRPILLDWLRERFRMRPRPKTE